MQMFVGENRSLKEKERFSPTSLSRESQKLFAESFIDSGRIA